MGCGSRKIILNSSFKKLVVLRLNESFCYVSSLVGGGQICVTKSASSPSSITFGFIPNGSVETLWTLKKIVNSLCEKDKGDIIRLHCGQTDKFYPKHDFRRQLSN